MNVTPPRILGAECPGVHRRSFTNTLQGWKKNELLSHGFVLIPITYPDTHHILRLEYKCQPCHLKDNSPVPQCSTCKGQDVLTRRGKFGAESLISVTTLSQTLIMCLMNLSRFWPQKHSCDTFERTKMMKHFVPETVNQIQCGSQEASILINTSVYIGYVTAHVSLALYKRIASAYFYAWNVFSHILHVYKQWLCVWLWALPEHRWWTLTTSDSDSEIIFKNPVFIYRRASPSAFSIPTPLPTSVSHTDQLTVTSKSICVNLFE